MQAVRGTRGLAYVTTTPQWHSQCFRRSAPPDCRIAIARQVLQRGRGHDGRLRGAGTFPTCQLHRGITREVPRGLGKLRWVSVRGAMPEGCAWVDEASERTRGGAARGQVDPAEWVLEEVLK